MIDLLISFHTPLMFFLAPDFREMNKRLLPSSVDDVQSKYTHLSVDMSIGDAKYGKCLFFP